MGAMESGVQKSPPNKLVVSSGRRDGGRSGGGSILKPVIDADPRLGRLHPERSGVLSLRGWVDRVSPPGLGVEEAILGSEGPSWWPYGPMLQKLWRGEKS